ncbi:MAG: glycosyltransferase [Cyanobacteria bacterium P01_F01_bin.150]
MTVSVPSLWPSVSVVIPIYNGEDDLPDLMACLWRQTYHSQRVEYLLVDNNSRDRTHTLLQSYAQQGKARGLNLKVLQECQIQSSYAARNLGIKQAKGDIIAFTDADCRPDATWLENLVQPFLSDPESETVLNQKLSVQEDSDPSLKVGLVAGEVKALPSCSLLEAIADRQETLSQKHTLAHPFRPYGQTANLAIRRSIFNHSGLFRPYLTTGGDADMCWRILDSGEWRIEFSQEAIVKHRHRSTLQELKKQWQRYGRSNRYLHALHNINLTRDLTGRDYIYRWSRWAIKELPSAVVSMIMGQGDWIDVVNTPVGLFCTQARSYGQRQAQLPPKAEIIDWLT